MSQIPNQSQTHLSHSLEALNQMAKKGAQCHEELEEVEFLLIMSHYMQCSKRWAIDDNTKSHPSL